MTLAFDAAVCASKDGAHKATSAQDRKNLYVWENIPAGENLSDCVFLISSRILVVWNGGRRTLSRHGRKNFERSTRILACAFEPEKETPSILPWQDRGRVKNSVSDQTGATISKVMLTDKSTRAGI
jgi:hypothetical protein